MHRLMRSPTGQYPTAEATEYIYLLSIKFLTFEMSRTYIFLRLEKGIKSSSMLYKRKKERCDTFSPLLSLYADSSPTQM